MSWFLKIMLFFILGGNTLSANANAVSPQKDALTKEDAILLETGEKIYEQRCITCHMDGLANAPRFQSVPDWKPRLAKRNLDALTASAIKGLNAMPAKGACWECSDDEIKAAIFYMVPKL